jgi:hypothetical protein
MSAKTVVIAKCVGCGKKREIKAGEIPSGSHPMCDKCYMPMIATEARAVVTEEWPRGPRGTD